MSRLTCWDPNNYWPSTTVNATSNCTAEHAGTGGTCPGEYWPGPWWMLMQTSHLSIRIFTHLHHHIRWPGTKAPEQNTWYLSIPNVAQYFVYLLQFFLKLAEFVQLMESVRHTGCASLAFSDRDWGVVLISDLTYLV
jgi:hypothetical protein